MGPIRTSTTNTKKRSSLKDLINSEEGVEGADVALGVAGDLTGALTADRANRGAATGKAIGSTIGAGAGFAIGGPIGAKIGSAVLGAAGGLLGGGNDRRTAENMAVEAAQREAFDLDITENINPYGRFEEGGIVAPAQQQAPAEQQAPQPPPLKRIMVERNELLTDKEGMIIEEFTNPNKYSKHAKNPMHEPMGNFIEVDPEHLVVPANKAKQFKEGDQLTRRSILRQLVDNQVQDPNLNAVPAAATGQFAAGGYTGVGGPGDEYDEYGNLIMNNKAAYPTGTPARPHIAEGTTPILTTNPDQNRTYNPADPTQEVAIQQVIENEAGLAELERGAGEPTVPDTRPIGRPKRSGNMLMRTISSQLPGIVQGIKSFGGDPHLRPERNMNMAAAKSYAGQMDTDVRVDAQLEEIDQSAAAALKAIGGANTPAARAEAANVMAGAAQAKAQTINQAKAQGAGLRTNKLQALMGLEAQEGATNMGENVRVQTERRMNDANRDNIQASVLDQNYRMFVGQDNDMEKIKAINAMTKFEDIDPFAVSRIVEDPEALNYIHMAIGRGSTLTQALEDWNLKTSSVTTKEKTTTNRLGVPVTSSTERIHTQKPTSKKD